MLLKNKITNAIKYIEVCKLTYYKLVDDLRGVSADPITSLAVVPETQNPALDLYLVDQKFVGYQFVGYHYGWAFRNNLRAYVFCMHKVW